MSATTTTTIQPSSTTTKAVRPTLAVPSNYHMVGCYPDTRSRLLDAVRYSISNNNGAQTCANACNNISTSRFYPWFGLENGSECYCGEEPTRDIMAPNSGNNTDACHMPCPRDNSDEWCGGGGYILLYSANPGYTPSGITPAVTSATSTVTGLSTGTTTSEPGSTSTQTSTPSSMASNAGVVAAGVLAGLLGLGLVCVGILFFLKRRKSAHQPIPGEAPMYDDNTAFKYTTPLPLPEGAVEIGGHGRAELHGSYGAPDAPGASNSYYPRPAHSPAPYGP